MAKRQKQRIPSVNDLNNILNDFKFDEPDQVERAGALFTAFVDPEILHLEDPHPLQLVQCDMAFTEWLLFDFDLGDGETLMKRAARKDPKFEEFAKSQFFSRFWVISQDPARGRSVLRDTLTCEDFEVRDSSIARRERWAKGTLGTRIACVNGVWRTTGQVNLHDNAESEPLPAKEGGNTGSRHDPMAFITNVEQVIGHNGAFLKSAEECAIL